jgi:glucosamine--fructose-6-phosphate aminotransferase (isomerizing)
MRKNTLSIFISQSGETADTIASLEYAKELGGKTLAIVNARETTIAREANKVIYTNAGAEIAVATTKGYTTQICVLLLIAIKLSKMENEEKKKLLEELCYNAPNAMKKTLENGEECLEIAKKIYSSSHIFYIGRGIDYDLSLEASLKLKEISYIHTEAYPSGELKHGTISLIEENTPVIAISTEASLYEKLISNLKEVKSRGAYTILIGSEDRQDGDYVIDLVGEGKIEKLFSLIAVIQKIAYEVSKLRGCDIDKPRNLAKSVTVE